MKKASIILSHLTNQPQFKVLKQESCYKKYISLLGVKWQKAIAFIYIKENTLFVAVTHPGFKMELNYNRDLLKSVLTQLSSIDPACEMMKADKVVVFHSKYRSIVKEVPEESTVPYYSELSTSEFIIENQDEEIKEKFEQIKEQIKKQLQEASAREI
jgi:hypothetical protein